jgi:chromosome segregation ATPase
MTECNSNCACTSVVREHPKYTKVKWRAEVYDVHTELGYTEWVAEQAAKEVDNTKRISDLEEQVSELQNEKAILEEKLENVTAEKDQFEADLERAQELAADIRGKMDDINLALDTIDTAAEEIEDL